MKSKGFTLIELLIAMAVFATAGAAVMKTASEHMNSISHLENLTFASYVAENQLNAVFLEKTWPLKSEQKTVEFANRNWLWQQEIQKTADANFSAVVVKVSLADNPEKVVYQLQTFVGKPDAER
ncbi:MULTISPECIES: type II secretion system minor pseudopilin GspI [Rheinheimera]|jgi:general secretion pathway protein I|uniref:type II secretion system minor pseudopilin GspI n=1 Tax=Rheinheimera TaxID=67575 RepID=UPI001E63D52A|nr:MULTISPECIES: type II secretion system minor pseudopilin GspI [Rheinheimera]HJS13676.1 type II secretion system minor pseudopilin GspI [Rheinheimera sp.]